VLTVSIILRFILVIFILNRLLFSKTPAEFDNKPSSSGDKGLSIILVTPLSDTTHGTLRQISFMSKFRVHQCWDRQDCILTSQYCSCYSYKCKSYSKIGLIPYSLLYDMPNLLPVLQSDYVGIFQSEQLLQNRAIVIYTDSCNISHRPSGKTHCPHVLPEYTAVHYEHHITVFTTVDAWIWNCQEQFRIRLRRPFSHPDRFRANIKWEHPQGYWL